MNDKFKNLTFEKSNVTYKDRVNRLNHKGAVLWFTGLSGSGKSTIARELEKRLFDDGVCAYVLDGDNIRMGLNGDLGFNSVDRSENIRRIAETAKLFANAGFVVITSFISPYSKDRNIAKDILGNFVNNFYIKASIEACKNRDPKGLYYRAMKGKIKNFTGVDDPYEEPKDADLIIDTESSSINESVNLALTYVKNNIL